MVSIEYSPNSRASCRGCHAKIAAGSIRVCTKGAPVSRSSGYINQYHHAGCYTNRKDFTKFWGFRDLAPEDQKRFLTEKQKRELFPGDYVADAALVAAAAAASVPATGTGLLKRDANAVTAVEEEAKKQPAKKLKSNNNNTAVAEEQSKLSIVGLKYAEVSVSTGEKVLLEREPENPYDSNAIKVVHAESKRKVGHIKKEDAAPVSKMLKSINDDFQTKRTGEEMIAEGTILNNGNGYTQLVGVVFKVVPTMKTENAIHGTTAASTSGLTPKGGKAAASAVTVSSKKLKGVEGN